MNTCLYYVLREKKMFLPIPIIRCSRYRKLHNKYIKFMHNVMELNQSHFYKILILKRFIDVENNALCVLVMGRVYPNPKTRPEPEAFSPTRSYPNLNFSKSHKPEFTRTRTFQKFINPNPNLKPAGLKNGKNHEK